MFRKIDKKIIHFRRENFSTKIQSVSAPSKIFTNSTRRNSSSSPKARRREEDAGKPRQSRPRGCLSRAYPEGEWDVPFLPALCFFPRASRDPQMQIPDRIYSRCRKRAADGRTRVLTMEIANPPRFQEFPRNSSFPESRIVRGISDFFKFRKILEL